MIVTEGGKNIYPEDIETAFEGLPVKEYCVFAANYLWPAKDSGQRNAGAGFAAGAEPGVHRSTEGGNQAVTAVCRISSESVAI